MSQKIRKLKLEPESLGATIVKEPIKQNIEINLQTQALVEATVQNSDMIRIQSVMIGTSTQLIVWTLISVAFWFALMQHWLAGSRKTKSSPTRHWDDD